MIARPLGIGEHAYSHRQSGSQCQTLFCLARTSSSSSLDTTITAVEPDDRRFVDGMRPPYAPGCRGASQECCQIRADALALHHTLHVAKPGRCHACSALYCRMQSLGSGRGQAERSSTKSAGLQRAQIRGLQHLNPFKRLQCTLQRGGAT